MTKYKVVCYGSNGQVVNTRLFKTRNESIKFARAWFINDPIKGSKIACFYGSDPYAYAAWKVLEDGRRIQDYNPPKNSCCTTNRIDV